MPSPALLDLAIDTAIRVLKQDIKEKQALFNVSYKYKYKLRKQNQHIKYFHLIPMNKTYSSRQIHISGMKTF